MMEFKEQSELYNRVYPALITKKQELLRKGLKCDEKAIWYYLAVNRFSVMTNLKLYDIIHEIMNLNIIKFTNFIEKDNLN